MDQKKGQCIASEHTSTEQDINDDNISSSDSEDSENDSHDDSSSINAETINLAELTETQSVHSNDDEHRNNITRIDKNTKCLKMFYTNADSLSNKFNELQTIVTADPMLEVVCITEVLPKNRSSNYQNLELPNYIGFHSNIGRGISIYTKKGLKAELLELANDFQESLWVKVELSQYKMAIVGCIYRSPNSNEFNNLRLLDLLEVAAKQKCTALIIVGDFNYKEVNWSTRTVNTRENHPAHMIFDKLNDLFLEQIITEPTRFRTGEQENTLDWLITNTPEVIEDVELRSPLGDKGDHCTMLFNINITTKQINHDNKPNFFRGDYNKMKILLDKIDWKYKLADKNCSDSWKYFNNIIVDLVEKYIPKSSSKVKPIGQSWISSEAKEAIRHKNRLWRKYLRNRNSENWQNFKIARNLANRTVNKIKSDFELKIAHEIKTNPKQFWKYVRSKSSESADFPTMIDSEGKTYTSDVDKANCFNKYFASVYTIECLTNQPTPENKSKGKHLNTVIISPEKINKLLSKLNISKAAGPDMLHGKILYELRNQIDEPLNIIFNKSFNEGTLPDEWKLAFIKPLHKKGSKKQVSNYRPVSLTSIVCKTFERLIRNDMVNYMEENNLLSEQQHGFRSGKSCTTQLLELMEIWTDLLDQGFPIDCIYLDFAKAFDKVPHDRLRNKLKAYGFEGKLWNWLSNFLSDRKQRVVINKSKSNIESVTSGIPQGSVLGPILFTIFINDLPDCVNSYVKIFADDTKVFRTIQTVDDFNLLQEDLLKLLEWSKIWQLPFNISKCKCMHYGRNNTEYVYKMEDMTLDDIDNEKDLGVIFDNKLNFANHISSIISKANSRIGIIKRNFSNLAKEVFLPLYKTLIRPILEYCAIIWNPHQRGKINEIEKVQRRATKLVKDISHLSYPERLKHLKLDSLLFRRRRNDMIQVFKIFSQIDKVPIQKFFTLNSNPTRGHNRKILKPRANQSIRLNSFSHRIVNDWNALSDNTVNAITINSFKTHLSKDWENHPDRYWNL